MKSHGVKAEKLYETMPHEPPMIYPSVEVPYEVIDGHEKRYQPGDDLHVHLHMKVKHVSEHHVSGELMKSEVLKDEK